MLFIARFWPGLADGTVTVAFRRWKRASVKAGGTLVTPAGVLAIDAVETIDEDEITAADALAAGYRDRAVVLADLRPEGTLYRVRFHRAGEDPRIALRQQDGDLAGVRQQLERLPWAVPVLRQIGAQPGVVSTVLAAEAGVERLQYKQRVRRLKALGLTQSLEIGYRLSPRGRAVLNDLDNGR